MTDNQDSKIISGAQAKEALRREACTPPTDRPLTAGDVPLLREGDVLRDSAGRTCTFDHMVRDDYLLARIGEGSSSGAGIGAFTFVSRPATSAASEGEAMRLVPDRVLTDAIYWMARGYERVHSMPRVSDTELANKIEGAKAALGRARDAALASPPVSERERELEGALKRISAMTPGAANAGSPRDLHLTVKAIADEALTAQPQEPV